MNKKFKYLGLILCLSLVLTMIFTTKVFANNYGTGDINLALDFDIVADGYTLNSVTVNGNAWNSAEDRFSTSDGNYTIVASITSENGNRPRIGYGGNWNDVINVQTVVDDNVYTITLTVNDARNGANPDNQNNPFMGLWIEDENQGEEPGPIESMFDGRAYLIWSCEDGGICMHYFDDIPDFNDGNSKFYKDTEITDDRTREQFSLDAEYKGWATPDRFNDWVEAYKAYKNIDGDIDWDTVNPEDMLGEPTDMREYEQQAIEAGACTTQGVVEEDFHACVDQYIAGLGVWNSRVQLQPLGEPEYNNAYVSYGDRNFKVVVYNENYKGITIGDLDELNYYPSQWNNVFLKRDQYDISDTTKESATVIDTILLEKKITIREVTDKNGRTPINNFQITNIEALDVPEGAVTINKVNSEWEIEFSSNYYDNVTFKVTDSEGEISYFNIKRTTIDCWIRNGNIITAEFFFDRQKSYTDFDLTAKIIYKNGSEKNIKLEAVKRIDDGLGNITEEYEVDEENPQYGPAGKGLKKSVFEYNLQDGEAQTIQDIYVFAEFKGSTDTNYAGAFSGSGKGVLANIYHPEEEQ